jgi:hypothetical protein
LENLRAGNVELSSDDLTKTAQLLETYPRKGGQYIDPVEKHLYPGVDGMVILYEYID